MSTDDHHPTIALIAAVAENGVIGVDGEMPWHLPADLKHFKETTMGHPVIMGRRTYESIAADIDGPLPSRTNIVLSRGSPEVPDSVVVADSVDAAVEAARQAAGDTETVYVIGGATVYKQFLPQADRLVLTEIESTYAGDTSFPDWERNDWQEVSRDERDGFAFVKYRR
ncbi:dihydrofolate reductase [Halohasta litchfieldiae]|jgi:dihydrofolate reductase|uniref:dihydrofolate reductase n=1 Tax=Halohasta litchfieldiae TaxID=1073996 RepID=A0A1H6VKW9_9EURY|nr:dihydrofolate reductase [Halohasta litchfieldiae]ATW89401.1 dihydrofolate reductase [Halohasta litchfieldiae]SEJ05253.1 dihydrofolate reductase [Halohasta litchfieldiae]